MQKPLLLLLSLPFFLSSVGQRFIAPPPLRTPGTLNPVPLVITGKPIDLYLPGDSVSKPFFKTHIVEVESYATADANYLLELLKKKAAATGVDGVVLNNLVTKSITTFGNVATLSGIGIKYLDRLNYLDTILRQRIISRFGIDGSQLPTLLLDYDWYGNLLNDIASTDVFFYADSMAFIDLQVMVNRHATYFNYRTYDDIKNGIIKSEPQWIRKIRLEFDAAYPLNTLLSFSSPVSTESLKVKVIIQPVYEDNLLIGVIVNSTQKGGRPLYYLHYKYDNKGRITNERWEKLIDGKRTLWLEIENRFYSSADAIEQGLGR
jgi:hypothetical protein